MAEKMVLVGLTPDVIAIHPDEQVVWLSNVGNVRVEFDPNRCPFLSNVFQAPPGVRLMSGPPRPGVKPGGYRYKVWLNEQMAGQGEVIVREK